MKVNETKSAVDHPWNRKFLGFTFSQEKGEIKVHESRVKRLKDKIRGLTRRMRGSQIETGIKKLVMPITRGWVNYFGIAEETGIFNALDGWIRRKIRGILWRQWKKPRTRRKRLMELGLKEKIATQHAYTSKGPWRSSRTYGIHKALGNDVIEGMGYISMMSIVRARSQCA